MSTRELPRSNTYPSPWCRIASCERPVDGNVGGPYCWTHRRTLRFSATLNDALSEFLSEAGGSMRPAKFNANEVREAGEFFALGLSKLFGAAFGTTVTVQPEPIIAKAHKGSQRLHWHVALRWQEDEGQPIAYAVMDDDDEADDWEEDDR